MSTFITSHQLAGATIVVYTEQIDTIYPDCVSSFHPPVDKADFAHAAGLAGYDWGREGRMRYGIEHDLAHHFLAAKRVVDATAEGYSRVVYAAARSEKRGTDNQLPVDRWAEWAKREEWIVNQFQRYTNDGNCDDTFLKLFEKDPQRLIDLTTEFVVKYGVKIPEIPAPEGA